MYYKSIEVNYIKQVIYFMLRETLILEKKTFINFLQVTPFYGLPVVKWNVEEW